MLRYYHCGFLRALLRRLHKLRLIIWCPKWSKKQKTTDLLSDFQPLMISSQIQTWLPMTLFVFCVFFGCYWKRYWLFFLVIRSLKFGYCDIASSRPQSLKTKAVCCRAYLFLSTGWTTNGFILTSLRESRSAASRRGAGVFPVRGKRKRSQQSPSARITQFDSWSRHLASSPLLSPPPSPLR